MQSIVESVLDLGIPTLSWNFQNSHCPQKHRNYIYKYTFYNALLVSVCSKAQTFFQTLHIAAGQGDADAMDGSLLSSTLLVAFGRVGGHFLLPLADVIKDFNRSDVRLTYIRDKV